MTQTQTPPEGTPDPDPRPDRTPGPDETQTRTPSDAQTRPDPDPDPDPDSDSGPGPESAQVRTPDPDPDSDPDSDRRKTVKIKRSGPGSGPVHLRTRTARTAQTARTARAETVKAAGNVRGWLGRGGYLTALTTVVALVAAVGQKVFAEKTAKFTHQIQIGSFDLTPWFAPAVFDLAVAALLHGGLRAARDRFSPWPWWSAAAVVAGLSIWTNSQHVGAQITASASGGLFLIWFLYLHNQYKKIVRERELEDSVAEDFLSTDILFGVDRNLARRAHLIAQTKPMTAALDYRHQLGEIQLTRRDLAIMAARIYNDVCADQLYRLTYPVAPAAAAPAGNDEDGKAKARPKAPGPVRFWQRSRRRRVRWEAELTASDAVDRLLGQPVPDRTGVVIAKVTYSAADNSPLLGAVTAPLYVPAIAPAAAPAAPALPPAAVQQPAITAAPRRPAPRPEPEVVVIAPAGAPPGNAGVNWLPVDQIEGLPPIDPDLMCECSKAKKCGKTLVDHVQRRGRYVVEIMTGVDDWVWREERIGKNVIRSATSITSSGIQQELAGLFDHLRVIARAHLSQDAAPVAAAEIEAAPVDAEVTPTEDEVTPTEDEVTPTAVAVVEEAPPES